MVVAAAAGAADDAALRLLKQSACEEGAERRETNFECQMECVVFPKTDVSLLCTRSLAKLSQDHTAATAHAYHLALAAVGLVTVDFGSVMDPVRKCGCGCGPPAFETAGRMSDVR
jgi:hypothetical protein